MSFKDDLLDRLFGGLIRARVAEATLAEEDRWWRSLTKAGEKDVTPTSLKDQLEQSLEAYRSNPLAFRIIELTTDYVLGRGIALLARDPRVAVFVTRFWQHPENRMDTRVYDMCTELSLAGELFVAFFTNPLDGMTYIRLVQRRPSTRSRLTKTTWRRRSNITRSPTGRLARGAGGLRPICGTMP